MAIQISTLQKDLLVNYTLAQQDRCTQNGVVRYASVAPGPTWKSQSLATDSTLITGLTIGGTPAAAADHQGQSNRALTFTAGGSDKLTASGWVTVGTSNFTLAGWVKSSAAGYATLFRKYSGSTLPYWCFGLGTDGANAGQTYLRIRSAAGGGNTTYRGSATNWKDGAWHHIAVTVTRNSATGGQHYVDGATDGSPFSTTAWNDTLENAATPYALVVNEGEDALQHNMVASNLKIWLRALTAAEIAIVYKIYP